MKRVEQKVQNTWDLTKIYLTEQDLKKDITKAKIIVEKLELEKGTLFESINKFEQNINKIFEYEYLIEKAYTYAHHLLDQDIQNITSQKLLNYVEGQYLQNSQKLDFLVPEFMQNEQEISIYLQADKFIKYRKYFNNLFRFNKYTLSSKEERILALSANLTSLPYKAYTSLTDSEFEYENIKVGEATYPLTAGSYNVYLTNENKEIREQAFNNLYEPYKKHNNTLAILLNGQIHSTLFNTKARNYETNIQSALFSTAINQEVYQNLITVINENININHEYVALRKEILQTKELHMYDLYVPLLSEYDQEITYKQAQETILSALQPLGEDYLSTLQEAFSNRWIDLYENEGKRSGAYSGGAYQTMPYILMNYTNKINDLYTLIHELGHSLHTNYSNQEQDFFNAHYKIFIAEVASTVNELLLTKYLLKTSDSQAEKAYILNYLLEQFRTTVIRQTMFAEFEKDIHQTVEQNDAITSEELNDKYYELNKTYFGENIVIDENIKYEWSRIPHFYYNFYVYQYATSFCAAIQIANRIFAKDQEFTNKYIEFLKLGNSVYPLDALKTLGIDLSQKAVIKEAMIEYQKTLKEFKNLIIQ